MADEEGIDDDDTDRSVAVNRARLCHFVLSRSLDLESSALVTRPAGPRDLCPAVRGCHLPKLSDRRFHDNFEFCRALALPFLDEAREELAASLEVTPLKTSPALNVEVEPAAEGDPPMEVTDDGRLLKAHPKPPDFLRRGCIRQSRLSSAAGLAGGLPLCRAEDNSCALACVDQHDSAGQHTFGHKRMARYQVVLVFEPMTARRLEVEQDSRPGVEVDSDSCHCLGILIVDDKAKSPLLCTLRGRCPRLDRGSALRDLPDGLCEPAPCLSLVLLDCNLLSSLRIAEALERPEEHCPEAFWVREVLSGACSCSTDPLLEPSGALIRSVQGRYPTLNESQAAVVWELADVLLSGCDGQGHHCHEPAQGDQSQEVTLLSDPKDDCGGRVRLVQGPPGTGKTQTVAALLDLLLLSRRRVLVCAPSNVAVAELVQRLLRERLGAQASSSQEDQQDPDKPRPDRDGQDDHARALKAGNLDFDEECLAPSRWLDDHCITHFLREMGGNHDMAVLLVEPPLAFLFQESNDLAALLGYGLDHHFLERELMLFPVNNASRDARTVSGSHWSLLAARRVGRSWEFEHYDSAARANTEPARRLAASLECVLVALESGDHADELDPPWVTDVETTQQRNGHDCGVYLLEFVRLLVESFPGRPSQASLLGLPENADTARARLRAAVHSGDAHTAGFQGQQTHHSQTHCSVALAQTPVHVDAVVRNCSLAEVALVASEERARITWDDIRARVFLAYRKKRVKRTAQFWLGEGLECPKPYLEQPPWVERGRDPLSMLLLVPERAFRLWLSRRSVEEREGSGVLSSAWSDPEGRVGPDCSLADFLRFAFKALFLVAERHLAELDADVPPADSLGKRPKTGEGKGWASAEATFRDILQLRVVIAQLRACLELHLTIIEAQTDCFNFLTNSSSHNVHAGGRAETQEPSANAPTPQGSSQTRADGVNSKEAIRAVLEAARGRVGALLELLNLNNGDSAECTHRAKRRLQLLVHPDKVPEDLKLQATEAFKLFDQSWQAVERACSQGGVPPQESSDPLGDPIPPTDDVNCPFQGPAATSSKDLLGVLAQVRKQSLYVRMAGCSVIEKALLQHCTLVFCTLSVSGRPLVRGLGMEVLIVDEACQGTEASALVPLHRGTTHLVLIGDPQQLPPTVKSKFAESNLYGNTTFERVLHSRRAPRLLNIQYRMHPDILHWPNHEFYAGQISSSPSVLKRDANRWVSETHLPDFCQSQFGPMRIFDTSSLGYMEQRLGHSTSNPDEARFLLTTLERYLEAAEPSDDLTIGIISPYRRQVDILQSMLAERAGTRTGDWLQSHARVSTVDGFQGKECDLILISCVRTGLSIGFVKDPRRLNVAVTRARLKCWIFGNLEALEYGAEVWKHLADFARDRGWVVPGSVGSAPDGDGLGGAGSGPSRAGPSEDPEHPENQEEAANATGVTSEAELRYVDPFEVFFTHDRIKPRFRNGTLLDDTICSILQGELQWEALPPMLVTRYRDGRLYSLSNRRLFVCRVLANSGVLERTRVDLVPFNHYRVQRERDGKPKWTRAYTTDNEGTRVRVVSYYSKEQWPMCRVWRRPHRDPEAQEGVPASVWPGERPTGAPPWLADLIARAPAARWLSLHVWEGTAGVVLTPTRWGMLVDAVDEEPGQPGLVKGDTIVGIGTESLEGSREHAEAVFGDEFRDAADILVVAQRERALALQGSGLLEASAWASLRDDVQKFGDRWEMEIELDDAGERALVRGPESAFRDSQEELEGLLRFYSLGVT